MPAFAEAVGLVASQLREVVPSHSALNRAATQIDQLGRRLHGIGFVHDREIAACFTAAIGGLNECRRLREENRREGVHQAVRQLELAMSRMETGGLQP